MPLSIFGFGSVGALRLRRLSGGLSLLLTAGPNPFVLALPTLALTLGAAQAGDAPAASPLTCAEMETFLRTAKIGVQRTTAKGVTQPTHAALDDGTRRHEAYIQTIHESRREFKSDRGDTEMNFKDWWEFNVAGYELAKILEINMVVPYVKRVKLPGGKYGSLSWGVEGMLEAERYKRHLQPPNLEDWNRQLYVLRVFDQLIRDTDPNLTNFIITPDWQVWRFDFTRAFRTQRDLANPKDLVQCDRKLLANLRKLNKPQLLQKLTPYVTAMEIDGLLARRDKIVKFFEDQIAAKGESAVLFDLPRVGQSCGVGLR